MSHNKEAKHFAASQIEETKITAEFKKTRMRYCNKSINNYLTPRELECMKLFCQGISAKQVGKKLGLSYRTVEFYLNNLKKKLNCHTRFELLCFALENHLIALKDL